MSKTLSKYVENLPQSVENLPQSSETLWVSIGMWLNSNQLLVGFPRNIV